MHAGRTRTRKMHLMTFWFLTGGWLDHRRFLSFPPPEKHTPRSLGQGLESPSFIHSFPFQGRIPSLPAWCRREFRSASCGFHSYTAHRIVRPTRSPPSLPPLIVSLCLSFPSMTFIAQCISYHLILFYLSGPWSWTEQN